MISSHSRAACNKQQSCQCSCLVSNHSKATCIKQQLCQCSRLSSNSPHCCCQTLKLILCTINTAIFLLSCQWLDSLSSEDCFCYCSERNNFVALFGTLKVQSFILTKVSDCGLLIVVTFSTFLDRKSHRLGSLLQSRAHKLRQCGEILVFSIHNILINHRSWPTISK